MGGRLGSIRDAKGKKRGLCVTGKESSNKMGKAGIWIWDIKKRRGGEKSEIRKSNQQASIGKAIMESQYDKLVANCCDLTVSI